MRPHARFAKSFGLGLVYFWPGGRSVAVRLTRRNLLMRVGGRRPKRRHAKRRHGRKGDYYA